MISVLSELFLILVLTIANGVFSLSETAIVSARKARLQELAENGDPRAQIALDLSNSPNQFLSTVQIGITLIGILSGVLGGATLAESIANRLQPFTWLDPYREAIGLGLVVLLITYLSLVIGELVPKRLALNNPEGIATLTAPVMYRLSFVTAPIVHLLSISTDKILSLLRQQTSEVSPVTEAEIQFLIEQGAKAGLFEAIEKTMVERVFRLGDRRVSALMTPRQQVVWLDVKDPFEINRQKMNSRRHSRFPVVHGGIDTILGIVHIKDLYARPHPDFRIMLSSSLRPPLFVPEHLSALKVLDLFKSSGMPLALVVDEYATVQGLVTLTDILEAIVGDVEDNQQAPRIVKREDGSWLVDGLLPISELQEWMELDDWPEEEKVIYHTVAGFVINYLGRIPTEADHFEWEGWEFEVVDMDGPRVDKILVKHLSPEVEESAPSS